ncbi:MAG: endopeptidase La [Peptococcaceae bacterium]|nr:endopeptidase La [Peptococcaceae bacterium]
MIIIPVYDSLMLPGVAVHFHKDVLAEYNVIVNHVDEEVLFLFSRHAAKRHELKVESFYPVGLTGRVEKMEEDGLISIVAENRVTLVEVQVTEEEIFATYEARADVEDVEAEDVEARFESLKKQFIQITQKFQGGAWLSTMIMRWKGFHELGCALAGFVNWTWEDKYAILAEDSLAARYEKIEQAAGEFVAMFQINTEMAQKQNEEQERRYKESAIRNQMRYLEEQLNEMNPDGGSDIQKFEQKIAALNMPEEAKAEAEKVLNRMKVGSKEGSEYGVLYSYLDFVTSLAWETGEVEDIKLEKAQAVLDEDHYGLQKVKDRIVQQLAVMALNKKQSGSILLFVGAPGTGKTSIGQSIARAIGRKSVRISLGGVKDEAEIRGHRRTYVGAMPGRIMEGIKRSGVQNPVMVLDEVDKLAKGYNGDPASALLEVLDPEQNHSFTDHYMNVPYDLSNVLFVCTANSVDTIPEPLLNRMEVIKFPGYTAIEKYQIAKQHLLPKSMKECGIAEHQLTVEDSAIEKMVAEYTAEAGVRGLRKQMDVLCRKAAVELVKQPETALNVHGDNLIQYLDKPPVRRDKKLSGAIPGVATGLAWTQAGGEILFMETCFVPGSGKINVTGRLGDVMKESAQIALTLVKSRYPEEAEKFTKQDLHIHVPQGAVPKDGPSAGITLVTALVSLVSGKGVNPDLAMTGEISLRGAVLPIGGLTEKLMAAQRAGIKTVLIPQDNVIDLDDVPEEVKEQLEIIPVSHIDEVLEQALG